MLPLTMLEALSLYITKLDFQCLHTFEHVLIQDIIAVSKMDLYSCQLENDRASDSMLRVVGVYRIMEI